MFNLSALIDHVVLRERLSISILSHLIVPDGQIHVSICLNILLDISSCGKVWWIATNVDRVGRLIYTNLVRYVRETATCGEVGQGLAQSISIIAG